MQIFALIFLFMWGNGLGKRLISKFMTLQAAKRTITMHILRNIFRSQSSQIVKFVQLVEHNVRNIFL